MKINFFVLLLFSLSNFVFAIPAIPNKPKLNSHIIDQAQLFSQAEEQQLAVFLKQYNQSAKVTMTILTIKSLEGEEIETYSIRVVDEWANNQDYKSDLLFIISKNDRKTRLEVGRNLEGDIPDAKAGDFLRALPPYFRTGDYFGGTVMIIANCAKVSGGKINTTVKAARKKKKSASDYVIFIIVIIMFILNFFSRGRGGRGGLFIMGSGLGGGGGGFSGGGGGWGGGGGGFSGGGSSGSW
ncbi:TPM domain-containing protein [Lentisphaera profundi]|uniref:TPM domain-containing protein n=1 Tax=Lentisphaera profundi TaxID=1658616 RepID=A0ABY7VY76_9BACT|nr:TPM domain-containing protein [Lentisphaera profundi]WDE99198.1 TPM domain-containing protein [Lentisphaera profundi]